MGTKRKPVHYYGRVIQTHKRRIQVKDTGSKEQLNALSILGGWLNTKVRLLEPVPKDENGEDELETRQIPSKT